MTFRTLCLGTAALVLAACGGDTYQDAKSVASDAATDVRQGVTDGMNSGQAVMAEAKTDVLAAVLDAQDADHKARHDARHPAETLAFFGIQPGMAVGEALPGGGWYSKVLLPYLGEDGRMVGVNYSDGLWSNFSWMTPENLEKRTAFPREWPATAREWTDTDIPIEAYTFETLPQDGSLDAFLFIRALHNLNRFEGNGGFMTEALTAVHGALKPGGVVGVVQHEAPADADADWADGSAGYLRRADVIATFEAAGFELDGSSDLNANPLDKPTTDDIVWRLKPSRNSPKDDTALREQLDSIGESNRMTLRFVKR